MPAIKAESMKKGIYGGTVLALSAYPAVIIYFEIIFRISTSEKFFSAGIFFTVLFSVLYGGIVSVVVCFVRSRRARVIISTAAAAVTAAVFLAQYFVYRQFRIFYDLRTVTGGASDAASGFGGRIAELIISPGGIFMIILYFLPVGLLAFFGGRVYKKAITLRLAGFCAGILVLVYFLDLTFIWASPVYSSAYKKEYNYQAAVSHFGLLTGIRLDFKNMITGGKDDFEQVSAPESDEEPSESESEPAEEKPVEYGFNQMDIDFEALAGTEKNSTVASVHSYVAGLTPSKKNEFTGIFKGKNLIMITAEAFSAEVIDEKLTPTLYRLATRGINFTDYYQPASAGTTGGEYQNLLGMLPMQTGMSMKNSATHNLYFTMGNQLNRLGYYGKAFHNNTYTFYDRDKTHINLGYSDGYMGYGNGMEKYVKNTWPQSDLEMIAGTLPSYIEKEHFNVYYMTVSGHGEYSLTGNSMSKKNWDKVKDLGFSEKVKCYLAANLELEAAMSHLVSELEKSGRADDTVICISSDHFPYSLDSDGTLGNMPYLSELYGYNVENALQRDHSRLILWCGSLEDSEPITVSSPTFSLDIVPTLSNLFGTEYDSRLLPGRDVFSDAEALVFDMSYNWKTDLGYYIASTGKFTPADADIKVPDGYVDRIKKTVRNKINYCSKVLETDYFSYFLGK